MACLVEDDSGARPELPAGSGWSREESQSPSEDLGEKIGEEEGEERKEQYLPNLLGLIVHTFTINGLTGHSLTVHSLTVHGLQCTSLQYNFHSERLEPASQCSAIRHIMEHLQVV